MKTAVAIILVLGLPAAALADMPEQCNTWLSEHYQEHEHVETIRDYERDGEQYYRANFRVLTSMGEVATIGFDCTVYPNGRIRPDPQTTPYAAEPEPADNTLPQARLKYGSDGCPDMSHWRPFVDAVKQGNYSTDLSNACVWLEEGQLILGPLEEIEYQGSPFALIQLPEGDRYWIESGNL